MTLISQASHAISDKVPKSIINRFIASSRLISINLEDPIYPVREGTPGRHEPPTLQTRASQTC